MAKKLLKLGFTKEKGFFEKGTPLKHLVGEVKGVVVLQNALLDPFYKFELDTPTIAHVMPTKIKRWSSFSVTNPSRGEGKLAYVALNMQTPCPPSRACGTVLVNTGARFRESVSPQHARFAFSNACDCPSYVGGFVTETVDFCQRGIESVDKPSVQSVPKKSVMAPGELLGVHGPAGRAGRDASSHIFIRTFQHTGPPHPVLSQPSQGRSGAP